MALDQVDEALQRACVRHPAPAVRRIVDKNDDYVSGSGELSGFRGAVETIVTDFAKGVGETEQQAKQRLVELVEDEYASTSSALDAVFGVV
jgi:hypothetical protein